MNVNLRRGYEDGGWKHNFIQNAVSKGNLVHPLRIAVSGLGEGPGVYDIVSIIGKEESLSRIETALIKLK